jgi:hypothetical protein
MYRAPRRLLSEAKCCCQRPFKAFTGRELSTVTSYHIQQIHRLACWKINVCQRHFDLHRALGQLVSWPRPWLNHHSLCAQRCNPNRVHRYIRHNCWRSALEDTMLHPSSEPSLAGTRRRALPSATECVSQLEYTWWSSMVVHAAELVLAGTSPPLHASIPSLGVILDTLHRHLRRSVSLRLFRSRKGCRAGSADTRLSMWLLVSGR